MRGADFEVGIREVREPADLADALLIAAKAHADQVDKAGFPYITHPLRMVEAALTRGCAPDVPIVAALHDVVEDSLLTLDDLRDSGFSERVVAVVDAVTRRDGESYAAFIERCRQAGAVARCVKLLDIDDNLDPRRLDRLDPASRRRLREKYEAARASLQALENDPASLADAHSKDPPAPPCRRRKTHMGERINNAKFIEVDAGVRYWEDATVNGVEDEAGAIPLKVGERWQPTIEIATGAVLNWPPGTTADIHYKVCDDGDYWLLDEEKTRIAKHRGHYVPNDILCIGDNGFGDYIILTIGPDGLIPGWIPLGLYTTDWEPLTTSPAALEPRDER